VSTNTDIEWTDATWSPVTGCDRVSDGCDNCYALTLAKRLKAMGSPKYQTDGDPRTSGPGFGVATHETALTLPLRWKKPRKIFVNSMSDLFHHKVPVEFIARVFAVMAATPQHTYQILTKRPSRARAILTDKCRCGAGHVPGIHFRSAMSWAATKHNPDYITGLDAGQVYFDAGWPLPNVWIGTSVENQRLADVRIPHLLATPAAVRWLSCEPLLGPIDLFGKVGNGHRPRLTYWLDGRPGWGPAQIGPTGVAMQELVTGPKVDWVVAGGESGAGYRPLNLDWARGLRDQCVRAGIPFMFKQVGGRTPRAGGRELDGRTWDQYPERAA
jgi:protein gp37